MTNGVTEVLSAFNHRLYIGVYLQEINMCVDVDNLANSSFCESKVTTMRDQHCYCNSSLIISDMRSKCCYVSIYSICISG